MTQTRSKLTAMAVALGLLAGALAGCGGGSTPSEGGDTGGSGGTASADNPFGVEDGSEVEAAIFDGGYSTDYVDFAADLVKDKFNVTTTVAPVT